MLPRTHGHTKCTHTHLKPFDSYNSCASSGAFSEAMLSIRTAGLPDFAMSSGWGPPLANSCTVRASKPAFVSHVPLEVCFLDLESDHASTARGTRYSRTGLKNVTMGVGRCGAERAVLRGCCGLSDALIICSCDCTANCTATALHNVAPLCSCACRCLSCVVVRA